MAVSTNAETCTRAREWACRRLDGELSEFEAALLNAHVGRCAGCREFARSVTVITGHVRETAPVRPTRPFVVPRRRRLVPTNAIMTAVAVVAVSITGVTLVASTPNASRRLPTGAPEVAVGDGALGSNSDLPLLRAKRVAQLVPSAIRASALPSRGLQLG